MITMYIPVTRDGTVVPPNTRAQGNLTRWYICETNVAYHYMTLGWLLGDNSVSENPSFQGRHEEGLCLERGETQKMDGIATKVYGVLNEKE